jgi:hypothetical protein
MAQQAATTATTAQTTMWSAFLAAQHTTPAPSPYTNLNQLTSLVLVFDGLRHAAVSDQVSAIAGG